MHLSWFVSVSVLNKPKKITYICPAVSSDEAPKAITVDIVDQQDFKSFLKERQYELVYESPDGTISERNFDSLEEGRVYSVWSPFLQATSDNKTHRQVEAKVLELEVAFAVKNLLGPGAHVHHSFKLKTADKQDGMEIDALVHKGESNVADSEVYFIECGINPTLGKVSNILKRVDTFKASVASHPHFQSVTKFVPVFGARLFSPDVDEFCAANGIWQVRPSPSGSSGYQVTPHSSPHLPH